MKIFVCIKQVPDTESKISVTSDSQQIDDSAIKWTMNPYDEFALEEAIQLKSKTENSSVTAVSIGPKKRVTEILRSALALGADESILIDTPDRLDSFTTASTLAKVIKENDEDFLIVFTGKQSIDENASSVSQILAELLCIPHATVVSKFSANNGTYLVERESENGTKEVLQIEGPCVIAANKGLNTPRYPKLPNILKAKKKPLIEIEFSSLDLNVETLQKITYSNFKLPPEKQPVKLIDGDSLTQVQSLVQLLKDESKVL